jgi:hypothetical protein
MIESVVLPADVYFGLSGTLRAEMHRALSPTVEVRHINSMSEVKFRFWNKESGDFEVLKTWLEHLNLWQYAALVEGK